VAIEVVRRYGKDDVVLLNHDINPSVEDPDIKRFKDEVATYLVLPVTYANHPDFATKDQFDVCIDKKAFQAKVGQALCTYQLKTKPFEKWLEQNVPDKNCVIYYGFDKNETARIQRRSSILGVQGYRTDYPLAFWERTILSTNEVGIAPPLTYGIFKHANCTGCIKAGKQHWYAVFCTRKDIWEKAKAAEETIGHSIMKGQFLSELEEYFAQMERLKVKPTEHVDPRTFFAEVRKLIAEDIASDEDQKPCECVF
jgi:hypothetical protein